MNKDQVLEQCTIEGNVVKLPDVQLERSLYMEVNKALQGIGGKWNRKEAGFVFPSDPAVLLGRVQDGEKINLKKDFQFFETPPELADKLVELAALDGPGKYLEGWGYDRILEPSAGRGAIIKAIRRFHSCETVVHAVELMGTNSEILKQMNNVRLHREFNFLDISTDKDHQFERIIANPPFTKNQDIDHVLKMYEILKPGGRLVSVMSDHWRMVNHQKCVEFRQWIDGKINEGPEAWIYEIELGTFKSSGTMVGGCIVVIDKPYE